MTGKLRIIATLVLLLTGMAVWTLPAVAQQVVVGPNVQVSKTGENDAHYEVLMAADPNNANRLLGGSMVWSEEKNTMGVVAYTSFDGGKTWTPTMEFTERFSGDPAVAYGPDGTAYFAFLDSRTDRKWNMFVHRSKEGGKDWLPAIELPLIDREYIAVDDTGGKYHGRIYIHGVGLLGTIDGGQSVTSITVFRSLDGGSSFELPVRLASVEDHYVLGMGNSVVLSDGTLVILFGELRQYDWDRPGSGFPEAEPSKPNAWLKVVTSENGGERFSKATIVSDFYMVRSWAASSIPYLAADRSSGPFKDRLYAVWPDVRTDRVQVLFSYSSDKGKAWSKPVVVNDDRPPADPSNGPDHFMPVVAVNPEGVVGVTWYDRRDSPNKLDYWARFTASLDGGETFLPSVKVSEAPFTHGENARWPIRAPAFWTNRGSTPLELDLSIHGFFFNGGDTAGMAADANGVFHPLWVDNRTGISQIWTTPVTVKGKAIRNGSPDLASLEDISEKVHVNYTNTHYDRATNIVSVDAQLENTSEETITGPVKARVISLKSDIGIAKILTTDNGEEGVGAVWDFTALLKDNKLEPKQKSGVKRLEFALSDLRSVRPRRLGAPIAMVHLVRVAAKLLGTLAKSDSTETPP